jgi:hypothetical protein
LHRNKATRVIRSVVGAGEGTEFRDRVPSQDQVDGEIEFDWQLNRECQPDWRRTENLSVAGAAVS